MADDPLTLAERRVRDAVRKAREAQITAIVALLRALRFPTFDLLAEVEAVLVAPKLTEPIRRAVYELIREAISDGTSAGRAEVAKLLPDAPAVALEAQIPRVLPEFDARSAELAAATQTETTKLSAGATNGITEYFSVEVKDLVATGIEDGKSLEEIADAVKEWARAEGDAARATDRRAMLIARTESLRARNKAEMEAWRAGGITGKRWLLAPDPCEFCEAMANRFGQIATDVGQPFARKGSVLRGSDGGIMHLDYEDIQHPPLHPNCRCSMLAALGNPALDQIIEDSLAEVAQQGVFDR